MKPWINRWIISFHLRIYNKLKTVKSEKWETGRVRDDEWHKDWWSCLSKNSKKPTRKLNTDWQMLETYRHGRTKRTIKSSHHNCKYTSSETYIYIYMGHLSSSLPSPVCFCFCMQQLHFMMETFTWDASITHSFLLLLLLYVSIKDYACKLA